MPGFVDYGETVVREFGRFCDAYLDVLAHISEIPLDEDSRCWIAQVVKRCREALNQAYEYVQGGTMGILEHQALLAVEIVRHFVKDARVLKREVPDPVDSVDAILPAIQRLLDSPWDLRLLFEDLVLAEPEDSGVLRGLGREAYHLSLDEQEDTGDSVDVAA